MTPGIYALTDIEYHAAEGISNSGLKLISRSPAHYYAQCLDPERKPEEPTPALIAGRALHTAILEPDLFLGAYAILPADAPRKPSVTQRNAKKPSAKTIESIEWWDNWLDTQGHKQQLKSDDAAEYQKIGQLIRNHPELSRLMRAGDAEQSIFANDPVTGVLVKCRTDWRTFLADLNVTCDYKSSNDARANKFQRDALKYGYFQQAPFHMDVQKWAGLPEVDLWLFAVFEKEPPYAIKLYEVAEQELERGRQQYRRALNTYAECLESNEWPSYDTTIERLFYPP